MKEGPNNVIPEWLAEFKEQIQLRDNFCKSHNEICALAYKNVSYVGVVFKKYYGETLNDFIHTLRLNLAAELLATTDQKVIDIFYDLGYENVSWANVLFKKKYGISPLQYRKENKKGAIKKS